MSTYQQDYKTTINVFFEDERKVMEETEDFWCGEHSLQQVMDNLCRGFNFGRSSWDKERKTSSMFIEGFGEFFENSTGIKWVHQSDYMGKIEVWYEEEFEEDFSMTKIS